MSEKKKKKTGADLLVEAFRSEQVDFIFGYPGGVVIPIFDVFYDVNDIEFILTRHEQAAVHAADGYARVTGKPGVCVATSGPGATNLVTGIATANMDSVPLVIITGQVKRHLIGNDAFQEVDVTGITRSISKHNYLVQSIEELPRVVKEAFYIATTGRPGPVVIDLPLDVTVSETTDTYPDEVAIRGYSPNYEGNIKQIKNVAAMINECERPVFYAGGGVIISGCSQELFDIAEKSQIPVTNTLLGLGSFPGGHELALGMLGMHGNAYANYAIMKSDLIIAVGARFDDRVTGKVDEFAPNAKIIHIDIDPSSISKNIKVDLPVVGDAGNILRQLKGLVDKKERTGWLEQIEKWKKEFPTKYVQEEQGLAPQYVVEQIYELTEGKAIITTEVGQNQMWTAQFYKFKEPRQLVSSGGLGTMGYGLPAAIGAQLGCPDRVVCDIAGDGSIQMNIQELTTAVRLKLPLNICILNNMYLGMVRQWQELFFKKRYSQTNLEDSPNFVSIAKAFGAEGLLVEKRDDVIPALREAFESDKTYVLDFHVKREENVFPMVPAGEALDRMIGGMA